MARKPSFDFERRERAKQKAEKRTEKAKAKAEKKTAGQDGQSRTRQTAKAKDAAAEESHGE